MLRIRTVEVLELALCSVDKGESVVRRLWRFVCPALERPRRRMADLRQAAKTESFGCSPSCLDRAAGGAPQNFPGTASGAHGYAPGPCGMGNAIVGPGDCAPGSPLSAVAPLGLLEAVGVQNLLPLGAGHVVHKGFGQRVLARGDNGDGVGHRRGGGRFLNKAHLGAPCEACVRRRRGAATSALARGCCARCSVKCSKRTLYPSQAPFGLLQSMHTTLLVSDSRHHDLNASLRTYDLLTILGYSGSST